MSKGISIIVSVALVLALSGCSAGSEACAASSSSGSSGRSGGYSSGSKSSGSSSTKNSGSRSNASSSKSSNSAGKSYVNNKSQVSDSGHPYFYGGLWYAYPWWLYYNDNGDKKCGSPTPPATPPAPEEVK